MARADGSTGLPRRVGEWYDSDDESADEEATKLEHSEVVASDDEGRDEDGVLGEEEEWTFLQQELQEFKISDGEWAECELSYVSSLPDDQEVEQHVRGEEENSQPETYRSTVDLVYYTEQYSWLSSVILLYMF